MKRRGFSHFLRTFINKKTQVQEVESQLTVFIYVHSICLVLKNINQKQKQKTKKDINKDW